MKQVPFAALLAAVVAALAYRVHALTRGGAVAAFAVGTAIFGALGWSGAAVLFAFFIPSTLLSRVGRARKRAMVDVGKHGPRDASQVLANGGVAALCALAAIGDRSMLAAAFAGALAAASSDTWGTEIGTLARQQPRSIVGFQPIPAGLSGGITAAGTAASVGGALVVAIVAGVCGIALWWPIAIAGFAGSLLDSVLGATVQVLRWCPACERACETNPHACGTPTQLRRGLGWLENDAVNLGATLCGAAVAAALVH